MSRTTPEIVTGARGAGENIISRADTAETLRRRMGLPAGTLELHSKYSELYLQITSPSDRMDPGTGTIIRTRALKVKFHQGRAIVDDPEITHRIVGCEGCKLHKEGLKRHPNYGLGKQFWDAHEAIAAAKTKRVADAVKTFKDNPEAMQALLADLGVEDFDLGKKLKEAAATPVA